MVLITIVTGANLYQLSHLGGLTRINHGDMNWTEKLLIPGLVNIEKMMEITMLCSWVNQHKSTISTGPFPSSQTVNVYHFGYIARARKPPVSGFC